MKKLLILHWLVLTFSFGSSHLASASHAHGGELSYQCVAPGVYVVNTKLYRDCTGNSAPTYIPLMINSPGCNAGRTINMNKVGASVINTPYCTTVGNVCNASRPNTEEILYSTTITFSAAEAGCPNWILLIDENSRPEIANLQNPLGDMYLEAYLNLNAGINNNSAQFNAKAPTVEYVCVGQETRVALTAYDPDGDSLSYELVAPMHSPGMNYTYKPVNMPANGQFINTEAGPPFCHTCTPPNPQYGNTTGLPAANYTPTFPLPSFNGNWASGQAIVPVQPYFTLDSLTSELLFRPAVYMQSTPIQGLNRYAVSVKVTEWRKILGTRVSVGNFRRDIIFNIEDCGSNVNPSLATIQVNGQVIQPGKIITVRPGTTLNMQVTSTDQAGDVVTMESNVTSELIGATFTKTTGSFPVGTITWAVPSSGADGIRYFYVLLKDNACPIIGKKTYVFGVKVSNSGIATGFMEATAADLRFVAYPNPLSDRVNFRFEGLNSGKAQIALYNSLGQEIDRITIQAGTSEVAWTKANQFPTGTYLARLLIENHEAKAIKFICLR